MVDENPVLAPEKIGCGFAETVVTPSSAEPPKHTNEATHYHCVLFKVAPESEKLPAGWSSSFHSGANGIRTRDPHTASVVRYQLRHSPRYM